MPKRKIKLGDELEDIVTKVRGIASGKVEYLDGTIYWIIQPPYDEGEKVDAVHSPDAYCRRVGGGVYPEIKPLVGFQAPEQQE